MSKGTIRPDPVSDRPLLLHCCCAPCASGCLPRLRAAGRHVLLYFSNSNIGTEEEFEKRLNSMKILAAEYQLELIVDPYDHPAWLTHVSALPDFAAYPERGARCRFCFEYSLSRAAAESLRRGCDFATTLTVSPHKSSQLLFEIGKRWEHFEPWDFKKKDGFKLSLQESTRLNLYRQCFCGCEFSLRNGVRQDA